MKITLISFDFWGYDAHIVDALRKIGVEANHIKIGAYRHKNLAAKAKNAFSKTFLKKNLKNELRLQNMMAQLKNFGSQDKILIINPELIPRDFHGQIKLFCSEYIAYLYDSLARCPALHLTDLFDEVFSFDPADCAAHGFQPITNYIYFSKKDYHQTPIYGLSGIFSIDPRIRKIEKIASRLSEINVNYRIKIVGKKAWKSKLLNRKGNLEYTRRYLSHQQIPEFYSKSVAILDLVRNEQRGLSFRIFEALALGKKIVTDNPNIKNYDFYNHQNILVVNEDCDNIESSFFETPYSPPDPAIIYKYSVENWVKTVFKL